MVGVLQHGVQSEDVSDAVVTATIDLPAGTSRKLAVMGMYWFSSTNLTVSAATYDGNALSLVSSVSAQDLGSNFYEGFLYYYDIPDTDEGDKVISFTFSAAVDIKAIAFAVLDDAVAGAHADADFDAQSNGTGNVSLTLDGGGFDSYYLAFCMTDDLDSPDISGSSTDNVRVRRSDLTRDALLNQVTIVAGLEPAGGSEVISIDYGANSKTFIALGAAFTY